MASYVLYPPILDSYIPAFKSNKEDLIIRFSLSKFNISDDFNCVHAVVTDQKTGQNIIQLSGTRSSGDSGNHIILRKTGIILNLNFTKVTGEDNLFEVNINKNDLKGGFISGSILKIQLRLSKVWCNEPENQANWIVNHSGDFSEWSTVCTTTIFQSIEFYIQNIVGSKNSYVDIDSFDPRGITTFSNNTLSLIGSFKSSPNSEKIKYCYFILYDDNDNELEKTGNLYLDDKQSFNYTLDYLLETGEYYKIKFGIQTKNLYEKEFTINIYATYSSSGTIPCEIITSENFSILDNKTTIALEEEEGRIAFSFRATGGSGFLEEDKIFYIRRSDSNSNFKKWKDIKVFKVTEGTDIASLGLFYDNSIESGIFYQYGLQVADVEEGSLRSSLFGKCLEKVIRDFEYSFLLGKNERQLKLKFNNNLNNFKYQVNETKIDTIGGIYPIITRNTKTYYRIFPISGLISFLSDDNNLFYTKEEIYGNSEIEILYNNHNKKNNINIYDINYERKFRDKVIEFLYDGEYKLFKSPTEGNIIVRLTDINFTPNQSLGRMIYNFSCNAHEVAEFTIENCIKFGLYDINKIEYNGIEVNDHYHPNYGLTPRLGG